jgi:predicted esterase
MLTIGSKSARGPLVFFLHGLGDSGDGLKDIASFFVQRDPSQTWVLPTARVRPVTINGGATMNAWYDIVDLSHRSADSLTGFTESVEEVTALIQQETAQSNNRPCFVGGFSQGGVVAIAASYSGNLKVIVLLFGWFLFLTDFTLRKQKLNGCFALSTYVVQGVKCANPAPLLWVHGDLDDVVPISWGQRSFESLKPHVADAKFKKMAKLGHGIDMRVVMEIAAFIDEKKD